MLSLEASIVSEGDELTHRSCQFGSKNYLLRGYEAKKRRMTTLVASTASDISVTSSTVARQLAG